MEIALWQILALTLLAGLSVLDMLCFSSFGNYPVIIGAIAGFIMGDVKTGLMVGGALQLMILGVGTYGGASIPDFMTGAIVGTAYAVMSGKDPAFAIALVVPVGLFMVQLDVLARFTNAFFLHRIDAAIERFDIPAIKRNVIMGALPWTLSRIIPVFIMLYFGNNMIEAIINYVPDWFMGGLRVAGGLLPAAGIAILLRYLPTPKYLPYLIFGFIACAYLKLPMLGVALAGTALAIRNYRQQTAYPVTAAVPSHQIKNAEDLKDGEYED